MDDEVEEEAEQINIKHTPKVDIDLSFSSEKHPEKSVKLKVHLPLLASVKTMQVKLHSDSILINSPEYELDMPFGALVYFDNSSGSTKAPKTSYSKKTKTLSIFLARQ
jgi:hypothetical protein